MYSIIVVSFNSDMAGYQQVASRNDLILELAVRIDICHDIRANFHRGCSAHLAHFGLRSRKPGGRFIQKDLLLLEVGFHGRGIGGCEFCNHSIGFTVLSRG